MSFAPDNFCVWFEIPVTDLDKATAFYNAVFKTELQPQDTGPNPWVMFPAGNQEGVSGHLYPGKPPADGNGPTIHLACPDALEDGLARVKEAGGQVISEPITIPSGRFAYCLDPDGNSIGLFTH